jgi:GLPGLI family protein
MKKIKLYCIVFCLFSNIIYSQKQLSGKIIYQYDLQEDPIGEDVKNQKVINRFKRSLKENKDKIKYELVFNESESNYKLVKNIILENNKILNYAILLTGGQEEIFVDLKEQKILKKIEIFGENFIVKSNSKKEWALTQETKTIGNYLCYKAILKQPESLSNLKKIEILAWYCPKIPIPFGPKGYSNLPGLILELKIGPIIYLATKIKLNQKEKMKVRKPTKGKILSEEEFDKMLKGLDKRKN